jgi:hypothetical protein
VQAPFIDRSNIWDAPSRLEKAQQRGPRMGSGSRLTTLHSSVQLTGSRSSHRCRVHAVLWAAINWPFEFQFRPEQRDLENLLALIYTLYRDRLYLHFQPFWFLRPFASLHPNPDVYPSAKSGFRAIATWLRFFCNAWLNQLKRLDIAALLVPQTPPMERNCAIDVSSIHRHYRHFTAGKTATFLTRIGADCYH